VQFGSVIAVSRQQSPRRDGLLLAANITEIDISIPAQPAWTPDDISNLRAGHVSTITRGSALAWLGHLNALRAFLNSSSSTALIIEDDVDWDIHLRTTQIPATASAFRALTSNFSPYILNSDNYWGNTSAWDIMWLGTCNERFLPNALRHPSLTYTDPTLPPLDKLDPQTAEFLASFNIPSHTRLLHPTVFPLCTFGYALTRSAAHRLLNDIAAREAEGGTTAYDVRVLEACRDLGMRCWSVAPELMRHLDAKSEIAGVDMGIEDQNNDSSEGSKIGSMAHTANIDCGVRSHEAFFTKDSKRLEYLQEMVGRQGKCLPHENS
jgi:hypothetical protein